MENFLSLEDAGKKIGVSATFIRDRIKDGSLESIKLGKNTVRIAESALQAFVESHKTVSK